MKHWIIAAAMALAACGPAAEKAAENPPEPVAVAAPAGEYRLDKNHASLIFRVNHLGLANYTARFTSFDATLTLDPANLATTSLAATVSPGSVETDYPGDYRAGHSDRPYTGWDDDLARSPEFFNAGQFAEASFQSTGIDQTGPATARVTGDLTLLGQTHPLTLDVTLTGSAAQHPFNQNGAVGFTAIGKFNRSQFGMTYLLQPLYVGDEVTIEFNGEFHQQVAPAN